jgi:hypothetical protein
MRRLLTALHPQRGASVAKERLAMTLVRENKNATEISVAGGLKQRGIYVRVQGAAKDAAD